MNQTTQTITRSHEFHVAHRVLGHLACKCGGNHGHTISVKIVFTFTQSKKIGYNIDFSEIKRVGCEWIDDFWDHGSLLNPHDEDFITPCLKTKTKLWLMSLNGKGQFCNPSAENLAKELFMVMEILFEDYPDLKLKEIEFAETRKCWTNCTEDSILDFERKNFYEVRYNEIKSYAKEKGLMEYIDGEHKIV